MTLKKTPKKKRSAPAYIRRRKQAEARSRAKIGRLEKTEGGIRHGKHRHVGKSRWEKGISTQTYQTDGLLAVRGAEGKSNPERIRGKIWCHESQKGLRESKCLLNTRDWTKRENSKTEKGRIDERDCS